MSTAKDEVRQILETLPDDATLEDVQYAIYVRERVMRGLRQIEEGKTVDQDEVERRVAEWRK